MKVLLEGASARHPAAAAGAAPALAPLDLALAAGEQLAVIGPSGAGKTTLLHLLACALRPQTGGLSLDGQDPWSLPPAGLRSLRSRLLLAPQQPPLPPRQRAVTAVLAGRLPAQGLLASLRTLVRPDAAALRAAQAALARVDLQDKLFDRVDRLSGGERQRVGLARALLADARLLLVDEPLSALDPARAAQAMATLTEAARERGATLVCTLHDVPMALRHFPRVLALRDGALAFDLPSDQVTPSLLADLYRQHEDELRPGWMPSVSALDSAPAAVLPVCR